MTTILYKSNTLLARSSFNGADTCVVTFASLSPRQSTATNGFAEGYLERVKLDGVYVTCSGNDWYQYEDTAEAILRIREALGGHKKVITYGSSMGGYAALLFARRLGAQRIVAVIPQSTCNPGKAPFDDRWRSLQDRITRQDDDMLAALGPDLDVTALFDPYHVDESHIRTLRLSGARLTELHVPFGGHEAAAHLRDAGLLSRVMEDALLDRLTGAAWITYRRAARGKSPTYWREMAMRFLAKRRHEAATRAALKLVEMAPGDARNLSVLSTAQRRSGRFRDAVPTLERLMQMDPARKEQHRAVLADAQQRAAVG